MEALTMTGIANQGEGRGERGDSACAATVDLWWEADVRPFPSLPLSHLSLPSTQPAAPRGFSPSGLTSSLHWRLREG